MVRITEIEMIRGGRVRISLEDGTRYQLLRSALRDRPMEAGQEVDPEEFSRWVLLLQYRPALDQAVAMLALRARSRGEIRLRLRRSGYSEETAEMVILKLEKNDLLNDREFADQWAQYRSGQKYGPRRISQELRMKGLSQEEANAALEALPEDELAENALRLARKWLRGSKAGEDPRKTRQRVLSAIVRRGFGWEEAREAVDQAIREAGMEEEETTR